MPHSQGSCAGFHVCTGHSRSKINACSLNIARLRLAPARPYPVTTDLSGTHGNDFLPDLAHLMWYCLVPADTCVLVLNVIREGCVMHQQHKVQVCTPTK